MSWLLGVRGSLLSLEVRSGTTWRTSLFRRLGVEAHAVFQVHGFWVFLELHGISARESCLGTVPSQSTLVALAAEREIPGAFHVTEYLIMFSSWCSSLRQKESLFAGQGTV